MDRVGRVNKVDRVDKVDRLDMIECILHSFGRFYLSIILQLTSVYFIQKHYTHRCTVYLYLTLTAVQYILDKNSTLTAVQYILTKTVHSQLYSIFYTKTVR